MLVVVDDCRLMLLALFFIVCGGFRVLLLCVGVVVWGWALLSLCVVACLFVVCSLLSFL